VNLKVFICILLVLVSTKLYQQSWSLQLSSTAEKDGKGLPGATIKLYQGSKLLNQSISGHDGDFSVDIPPNGEFILVVSFTDCNTKKFQISTLGVPDEVGNDRFRPSFEIGGVTMSKPLYGIDYSALNSPLVKIAYMPEDKKFDHDENHTELMLLALGKIKESEKALIKQHQEICKSGDMALKKKDCELAKQFYEKALALIPQLPYETYPKEQLLKTQACLNQKNEAVKKQNEDLAAKAAAEKAALEKAETERLAKEKAKVESKAAEQAAKEKAEKEMLAAASAAASKAETERQAKEKAEADKLAMEKSDREKKEKEKLNEANAAAAKAETERLAKQKTEAENLAAAKSENKPSSNENLKTEIAVKEKETKVQTHANKAKAEQSALEKPKIEPTASKVTSKDNTEKEAKKHTEQQKTADVEKTTQKEYNKETKAKEQKSEQSVNNQNKAQTKETTTLTKGQDKVQQKESAVIKPISKGEAKPKKKKKKRRSKSHHSIKQKL